MRLGYINRDMTINGGGLEDYINTVVFSNEEIALLENAKKKAKEIHDAVNHLYDGKNYFELHILNVYNFGLTFINLIPKEYRVPVLIAILFHDSIEDARITYNDIKDWFGEYVANVVYALTNEKGKTRKERANNKYYKGIREIKFATFVKLMDRLANLTYSRDAGSTMFKKYVSENPNFVKSLKGTNTIWGYIVYETKQFFGLEEADYSTIYQQLEVICTQKQSEIKIQYNEV